MAITFAVAVNDRTIFGNSLLASPCFSGQHEHEILAQENFISAATAFNDAIDRSANDVMVFAHQDVVFPSSWPAQLNQAMEYLKIHDPDWGVLGCWGAAPDQPGVGYIYSNGLGLLGQAFEKPVEVQTLDEVVLILRKSSGLRFDERLPHFHFYGAALCLTAAHRGMKSYVIPALCIHNTQFNLVLPREFYASYKKLKQLWPSSLPIQTSCIRVTRYDIHKYKRQIREGYLKYIRRRTIGATRVTDVNKLLGCLDLCRSS